MEVGVWLLELFGPRLHFQRGLWDRLCGELHARTQGMHESGAFLLGSRKRRQRYVHEVVYYDDLAPDAYSTGIVVLRGAAFPPLWSRCRDLDLEVVADVHVHAGGAWQSEADRRNPMIAKKGHIALIFPDFAELPVRPLSISMFEYQGAHSWRSLGGRRIGRRLKIAKSR
jgi:proteasome lid subunit RPN8/RPN11